ncbi:MAG: alpha-glycosidase, partial [Spirochaetota bacterium]
MDLEVLNNSPPGWVKDSIFYQIFPDRFRRPESCDNLSPLSRWGETPTRTNFFGGNLEGVIEKLDYLEDLGINA